MAFRVWVFDDRMVPVFDTRKIFHFVAYDVFNDSAIWGTYTRDLN